MVEFEALAAGKNFLENFEMGKHDKTLMPIKFNKKPYAS